MLAVKFTFTDANGRSTARTWTTTSATLADAIVDVGVMAGLIDAISDCGLSGVVITQKDEAANFTPVAASNLDVGATFNVTADDGFKYNIKLPIPVAAIQIGGGAISLVDLGVVAFLDQFLLAGKWRVNNRNPQDVVLVNTGTLDL